MRSTLAPVIEGDGKLMRDIMSPPPGDVKVLPRKASRPELAKQRSQYFEDAFRTSNLSAKNDAVERLSIIHVEVRTNVFVRYP